MNKNVEMWDLKIESVSEEYYKRCTMRRTGIETFNDHTLYKVASEKLVDYHYLVYRGFKIDVVQYLWGKYSYASLEKENPEYLSYKLAQEGDGNVHESYLSLIEQIDDHLIHVAEYRGYTVLKCRAYGLTHSYKIYNRHNVGVLHTTNDLNECHRWINNHINELHRAGNSIKLDSGTYVDNAILMKLSFRGKSDKIISQNVWFSTALF